jgi:hypothetical protein
MSSRRSPGPSAAYAQGPRVCAGESNNGRPSERIDAPACGFDEFNITVSRVRAHTSATASDSDSGWTDITLTPPRKIDLLGLVNGALHELGQTTLAAKDYAQLRLVLQPNGSGAPANSVVPAGGSEQPRDVPDAATRGIRIAHAFSVGANATADLLLDFNACKSIVRRSDGTFLLKPLVTAASRTDAEIVGNVERTLAGAVVSAQVGGNVMRATVADANGAFKLAYLNHAAASSVDVAITANGRTTAVIAGVPIAAQTSTRVSTASEPIALLSSQMRNAGGHIDPEVALARVRALQAVESVPRIEVAATNANEVGSYGVSLPAAPPLFATYGTTLPLIFTTALASMGQYTLVASADGYAAQSAAVDVTFFDASQDFVLGASP